MLGKGIGQTFMFSLLSPFWQMLRVGKAKADVWPKTAPKKGESWAGKGKLGPTPFNKKEL